MSNMTPLAHPRPIPGAWANRAGHGSRRLLLWLAIALGAAGTAAYLVWAAGAERRALQGLPAEERRALYLRTVQELESACANPPEALRVHCRQEAEFLSSFPECDRACQELVRRSFPPQPAR